MTIEYIDSWGFFKNNIPLWTQLFPAYRVGNYLEVGTCEGASLFWLASKYAHTSKFNATVVDLWPDVHSEGYSRCEKNFRINATRALKEYGANLDLEVRKGVSTIELAKLVAEGRSATYDLVYVDGDHTAPNVITDCALSFELTKLGGLLILDDYTWGLGSPLQEIPKLAIDSFLNCFSKMLEIVSVSNLQVVLIKKAHRSAESSYSRK
jgi:predicted O-methyltransferase YrrM